MPVVQVPQFGLAQAVSLGSPEEIQKIRAAKGQGLANQVGQMGIDKAKVMRSLQLDQTGGLTPESAQAFAQADPMGYQEYTQKQADRANTQKREGATAFGQAVAPLLGKSPEERSAALPDVLSFLEQGGYKAPENVKPDALENFVFGNTPLETQLKPKTDERPADVKEYEYYTAQEKGAGRPPASFDEWRLKKAEVGAPKNTTVTNVSTGVPLSKEIAKGFAKELSEYKEGAESAFSTLPIIDRAEKLVNDGIVAGTGADWRLAGAKALATVTGTPDSEVNNTDEFLAATGQLVAQNIKNFGAGTGLSDADRAYAEKMAGGNTKLTPQAIQRILKINKTVQLAKIDKYNNRRADLVRQNPELEGYYPEIQKPQAPEKPKGSGRLPGNQIPTVNSREARDKIPSGSDYWYNGVRYTKQ